MDLSSDQKIKIFLHDRKDMSSNSEIKLLELMKSRRSVRSFLPDPVEEGKIQLILEAARWCQSASNRQPWRFIVIKKKEKLTQIQKLAPYGNFIDSAPLAIAIVADTKLAPNWYIHDTSMVAHQICLISWGLGLGTCWIGSLNRDVAGKILNLGKNEFLTTILPIGYPKNKEKLTSSRKELDMLVEYIE